MEYLIFSDSHGCLWTMEEALERQVHRPEGIFYLGDGLRDIGRLDTKGIPVYSVRGNCDSFFSDPLGDYRTELCFTSGEHTFFLTHGHGFGVKSGLDRLISAAADRNADLVFYGHTHRPQLDTVPAGTAVGEKILTKPMYLFNPGSIGRDRKSFGVLTLQNGQVLFSHGTIS